jgi:NAD(P)-dependent dehydrogenase (short-subunit alcohol dehydrogenase family)
MKDKIILITGATGGIGRALSKRFAAEGATIILMGRNIKALESVYDEIEDGGHAKPAMIHFDLATAKADDYQTLYHTIEKEFGQLHGLIHLAADLGSLTPIEHYSMDQWMRVLQVNLNSAFLLTQTTLPLLKKSRAATIIFTLCDQGKVETKSKAYWGAYKVSKCAVEALAQILAEECETHTNIQVHSVNPGQVRTRLRQSAYPAESQTNLLTPDDVLHYYLSAFASYKNPPDSA